MLQEINRDAWKFTGLKKICEKLIVSDFSAKEVKILLQSALDDIEEFSR